MSRVTYTRFHSILKCNNRYLSVRKGSLSKFRRVDKLDSMKISLYCIGLFGDQL